MMPQMLLDESEMPGEELRAIRREAFERGAARREGTAWLERFLLGKRPQAGEEEVQLWPACV